MRKYIRNNFKRMAVLLLIVCIVLPSMTISNADNTAAADDLNARIAAESARAEQLQQRKEEIEAQIRDAQGDMNDMTRHRALIEQQIAVVRERIEALAAVIALQEEAIEKKEQEIEELEREILQTELQILLRMEQIELLEKENEENKRKFGQIVKGEYMSGGQGFMNLLLNSGDFFDLVIRAEAMKKATERHDEFMSNLLAAIKSQEDLIQELEDLKISLEYNIETCEREKAELEEEKRALLLNMAELDAEMDREQGRLRAHASDIADLQSVINNMYRQYNATNAEIEAANNEVTRLIQLLQNLNRPDYSGDGFMWPLDDRFRRITSDYGWCSWRGGPHHGFDVGNAGINGANIYAVQNGTVISSGWIGGYGNTVVIDHGGGISTLYAHIQSGGLRVSAGEQVRQGDVIGLVGSTGWSTGPHLHFEVRRNGTAVNPWDFF
jgi:murein DD-endopeptidase MepM/ murein hydrolase activator NlpD